MKQKHFLFPIIYEYAINNLIDNDVLILCLNYFGNPERIFRFLIYTVPLEKNQFLIPYNRDEGESLIKIVGQKDRIYKLVHACAAKLIANLPHL